MKRLIVPAIAALALSACASTPTVYQPSGAGPNAVGYSEYRIEPGRYRVTFRGGPGATPERVTDLALRRAADLAVQEGFDWFRVSDRSVRPLSAGSGPRIGIGVGGGDYGRHSGVGVGLGTSFGLGGGPSYAVTLEVFMGRGAKAPGVDAYDAREIRRSLGAAI